MKNPTQKTPKQQVAQPGLMRQPGGSAQDGKPSQKPEKSKASNDTQKNKPSQKQPKSAKPGTKAQLGKILAVTGGALAMTALVTAAVYYTIVSPDGERVILGNNAETLVLTNGTSVISQAGTYKVTGEMMGQIQITAAVSGQVELVLSDATIISDTDAPIYNQSADAELIIVLEGANTIKLTATTDPDSAIHSKGDLVVRAADGATLAIESTGKGIKAKNLLTISSGEITVDSVDDAVHSNNSMKINGGTLTLSTGDDAVHADADLIVSNGQITVLKSNEGLEANILTIDGGTIDITASDDGINATNSDGSSQVMRAGDAELIINGGVIKVNARGDGLDSNGKIKITGGEIYIDGPADSANAAVDADGEIVIEGGILLATGASGMAQNATSATQPSVLINLSQSYEGTVEFNGLTFTPSKKYSSVLVSAPTLKTGTSYDLKIAGSTVQSVTVTDNITTIGGGMMNGGGMGGGRFPNGAQPDGMQPDGAGQPNDAGQPDGAGQPNGEMPSDRPNKFQKSTVE